MMRLGTRAHLYSIQVLQNTVAVILSLTVFFSASLIDPAVTITANRLHFVLGTIQPPVYCMHFAMK